MQPQKGVLLLSHYPVNKEEDDNDGDYDDDIYNAGVSISLSQKSDHLLNY